MKNNRFFRTGFKKSQLLLFLFLCSFSFSVLGYDELPNSVGLSESALKTEYNQARATDVALQAQKRVVTGVVTDANNGETIVGANVTIKGTTIGVATDVEGKFSLEIRDSKDVLLISFVGYKTREVEVGDLGVINVKLESENEQLNEVVVVGEGVQKKVSVVGAITTIKSKDLKIPSSSLTNAFAGRLAGVIATTSSGEPGKDASAFYIRGIGTFGGRATPLIVLDGVEVSATDLNYVPAENIASFSILKDASATAIYGARGANGVMIVTTKVGTENTKARINVTLENAFNISYDFPDFVDGATYMEMRNRAISTRSGSSTGLPYSQDKIEGTRKGVNPYIYPDVNWQDLMFKKMATSQRANVNVSGGGQKMTYYMSMQVNHDGGLLNTEDLYSYRNNVNLMSYTFQNNVDYKVTPTTKIGLRMNAQMRQLKGPQTSTSDLFQGTLTTNPVAFPAYFPDGMVENADHRLFGSAYRTGNTVQTNPYAAMLTTFKQTFESTVVTTVNIEQDLDVLTKGFKIKGMASFKNWSSSDFNRTIEPYYYNVQAGSYNKYDVRGDSPFELERIGTSGTDYIAESDVTRSGDRSLELKLWLEYNRVFGKHTVGGMLFYQQREVNEKVLPTRNQGISGRATYDFDNRYLFEFNFGYNGTERLNEGNRFKFFPAVAMGWVVTNEKFFEPCLPVISNLKFRGSYGLVGNDQTGLTDIRGTGDGPHFIYLDNITLGNKPYTTGVDMTQTLSGPTINLYGNKNGTWEVSKKTNIGVDLELFRKLSIVMDYFWDHREKILLKRESWPEQMGYDQGKPWANVGKLDNHGLDLSVNYLQDLSKDLSVEVRGTFTYTKNKLISSDEPYFPNEYERSEGRPLNFIKGYVAERLFVDQADIDNNPSQTVFGSVVMPGDIKYKDLNGDNKIDNSDMTMISPYNSTPGIMYGFGATVMWKNFDFGVFFQGAGHREISLSGFHPFGTGDKNIFQFIADDYWTEENPNPYAAYPRLSTGAGDGSHNNVVTSTYWLRDGSYLRFKNAEIGYNFAFGRVYVSGNNLATFSKFKLWDPELAWYAYPLQRTVNIGVQFHF